MDTDYIYKRLDNASLGHEADLAWLLTNLQEVTTAFYGLLQLEQEVRDLEATIEDLEERLGQP